MPRGGKRDGAGRPAYEDSNSRLNVQVAVRMTANEKQELEKRAKMAGVTVSKYIHNLLFG